jgi:hypothetical protein
MKLVKIKEISGELLSRKEFKEYIIDYFENYRGYKIDRRSRYFKEIEYCYNNLESSYNEYKDLFLK